MTVGMILAALAFVAAALVQLEIDVRPALAAVFLLYRGAVRSKTSLSLLENAAKIPRRNRKPSEVHQYAEQRS